MRVTDISANSGPMLNAYPDSMGGTLGHIAEFLNKKEMKDVFSSFYILPSIFNTDLDRGFSVIDYSLNDLLAKREDLNQLEKKGIDLKLDFILNHASVLSSQFQDIIKKGEQSEYKNFFIDWNKFWEGHGTMTEDGFIQPDLELIQHMFFRKTGLPILMVRFPDGKKVPYWNTFYQEIKYPKLEAQDIMEVTGIQYTTAEKVAEKINNEIAAGKKPTEIYLNETYQNEIIELIESRRKYLGQMDLNIKSPLVWEFYEDTLKTLSEYGTKIVRLDAFAYASKEPGKKNFLNEPETWDLLEKVKKIADKYHLILLPEIHASYADKNYEQIAQKGYMTYDFFLPGLIIDAFERRCGDVLEQWANELKQKKIRVVNMLGSYDGIPLLDLRGLIPDERIQKIIDITVERGGFVKDLHGQKNVYYQVNATYYSALGENDEKMLFARALQLFMPGKPQVWYLDLFAGKNDYEEVKRAGVGGHKEINRTNLTTAQMDMALQKSVVQKQLEMIRFRNTFAAFGFDSELSIESDNEHIHFLWAQGGYIAELYACFADLSFSIKGSNLEGKEVFIMEGI